MMSVLGFLSLHALGLVIGVTLGLLLSKLPKQFGVLSVFVMGWLIGVGVLTVIGVWP